MSAPHEPPQPPGLEIAGCLAVAGGAVLGVLLSTFVSMGLITLNTNLDGGLGCEGPRIALAALNVAIAAALAALVWYVWFGVKVRAAWVVLVRVTATIVATVALIPWPCGATFAVVIMVKACR